MVKYENIVINSALKMSKSGLTLSTWGNISVRDPKTGNIYLTPSGMDYKKCKQEDIIVFDAKGKRIHGIRKPSIEKDLHLYIFKRRPEVNAIIHFHGLYSTALASAQITLPAVTEEFAQILGENVPCSEYALPGSPLLAENVSKVLEKGYDGVLLPNHGAVCVGGEMARAFRATIVLEKAAQIYIMLKSMNVNPRIISKEDVEHMHRFFKNQYGQ